MSFVDRLAEAHEKTKGICGACPFPPFNQHSLALFHQLVDRLLTGLRARPGWFYFADVATLIALIDRISSGPTAYAERASSLDRAVYFIQQSFSPALFGREVGSEVVAPEEITPSIHRGPTYAGGLFFERPNLTPLLGELRKLLGDFLKEQIPHFEEWAPSQSFRFHTLLLYAGLSRSRLEEGALIVEEPDHPAKLTEDGVMHYYGELVERRVATPFDAASSAYHLAIHLPHLPYLIRASMGLITRAKDTGGMSSMALVRLESWEQILSYLWSRAYALEETPPRVLYPWFCPLLYDQVGVETMGQYNGVRVRIAKEIQRGTLPEQDASSDELAGSGDRVLRVEEYEKFYRDEMQGRFTAWTKRHPDLFVEEGGVPFLSNVVRPIFRARSSVSVNSRTTTVGETVRPVCVDLRSVERVSSILQYNRDFGRSHRPGCCSIL